MVENMLKTARNLDILVLFVHPNPQRSRVNKALREAISDVSGINIHDLYEEYPDFFVDVEQEQARLLEYDVIVFQHPLYWYSAPAILKEWQVMVLEHGWAHGKNRTALHGKYWLQAVTMSGVPSSYSEEGHHGFSMEEFLRPFEATAKTCQMLWLPPFLTYGTLASMDEGAIATRAVEYREHLIAIRDGGL